MADHALSISVLCEGSDLQKQDRWPITAKSAIVHFWHVKDRCRCAHKDTYLADASRALDVCHWGSVFYWLGGVVEFRTCIVVVV